MTTNDEEKETPPMDIDQHLEQLAEELLDDEQDEVNRIAENARRKQEAAQD